MSAERDEEVSISRAELERLRESESRLRSLLAYSSDLTLVISGVGTITYVSPSIERVMGYQPDEVLGRSFLDFIQPHDRERAQRNLARTLEENGVLTRNLEIFDSEGAPRVIDCWGQACLDNPAIQGYVINARDVSAEVSAREELEASDQRFQSYIAQTTDGVFCYEYSEGVDIDLSADEQVARMCDGRLVVCNDIAARAYGFDSPEDVLGARLIDLEPQIDRPALEANFRAFIASNYRIDNTPSSESFDGERRYYLNNGFADIVDGKHYRTWGTFRDVTSQVRAEHELQLSEERFRSLMQSTREAVVCYEPDQPISVKATIDEQVEALFAARVVACNSFGASLHGKSDPNELLGKPFSEFARQPYESYVSFFKQYIENGYQLEGDRSQTTDAQDELHTYLNCAYGVVESGFLIRSWATSRNITEAVRAEQALRKSEERMEQVLASLEEVVWSTDKKGRLIYVSPSAQSLYGYSAEELLERHELSRQLVHPEDRESGAKAFQQALEMDTYQYEVRIISRDQKVRWLRNRTTRRVNNKGEVDGLDAVTFDVTEQRHLEEELRRHHRLEALGTLTGGIAHEFNNILAPIMGYAELLGESLGGNPKHQRKIGLIQDSGRRAKELVQRLLSFGRKEGFSSPKHSIDVTTVVMDTCDLLKSTLPASIQIEADLYSEPLFARGNSSELHQVLLNLAVNAQHAMEPKGGVLTVSTRRIPNRRMDPDASTLNLLQDATSVVAISVSDTGKGIPEEILDSIFDPFFSTKKRDGTGTGLGLAIVAGIIEAAGGKIQLESELGKGTTFTILLPESRTTPRKSEARVRTGTLRQAELEVVILDDESEVRDVLSDMLLQQGSKAKSVDSADALFTHLEARRDSLPDVVITDYAMPDMVGSEVAEELKARYPDLHVVLCTGLTTDDAKRAQEGGAIDQILTKPLTLAELGKVLRRAMKARRDSGNT